MEGRGGTAGGCVVDVVVFNEAVIGGWFADIDVVPAVDDRPATSNLSKLSLLRAILRAHRDTYHLYYLSPMALVEMPMPL